MSKLKQFISKSYIYLSIGAMFYSNCTLLQTLSKIDDVKLIVSETKELISKIPK